MTARRGWTLAAGLLLLAAVPVQAGAPRKPQAPVSSDLAESLRDWQAREARVFAIAWRLASGNAPFCADAVPGVGLLLHDAGSYADSQVVRAALGLSGPIGVQAVAPDSPAARAGIRADATLLAVDGEPVADLLLDPRARWRRLADLNTRLDEALARRGAVSLRWQNAGGTEGEARLTGTPACPSRIEVLGSGKRVLADGTRILLGRDFVGFGYGDPLLAAAIAHELAHNLLGHRRHLDAVGRARARVRATEDEADRLMPWLLANGGFDPDAAQAFMERWGPGHDGGLLRARTHAGWDERAAAIAAETALVRAALARSGRADWRARFRPAPLPRPSSGPVSRGPAR